MLDNLKRWYELLSIGGSNTKAQVRKEIEEIIKMYEVKNGD